MVFIEISHFRKHKHKHNVNVRFTHLENIMVFFEVAYWIAIFSLPQKPFQKRVGVAGRYEFAKN